MYLQPKYTPNITMPRSEVSTLPTFYSLIHPEYMGFLQGPQFTG